MISIVFVHYAQNEDREKLARDSLDSLIKTTKSSPCEIIVVDNGGSEQNSRFFLEKAEKKEVAHYVRNADNLQFGYAFNQGAVIAQGEYLCFTCDDIFYEDKWSERCQWILDNAGDRKIIATPLEVIASHRQKKYERKPLVIGKHTFEVNAMAGSNCFMVKRNDFWEIGFFENHRIAGTRWCQRYNALGYGVAVFPQPKANHLGLKGTPFTGYDRKENPKYIITLSNGKEIEHDYYRL